MANLATSLILTPLSQTVAATCTACLTPVNDLLRESVASCLLLSSNQSSLDNSLRQLQAMAEKLMDSVKEEEAQLRICNPDVREWLKKVEEIMIRAKTLFDDNKPRSIDSQHGTCTCCNITPFGRFRIGRKVSRVLQDANGLLIEGVLFAPPFTSPPPSEAVLFLPVVPTFGIDAVMNQVWSQFNDKHKSVIGLYGLAGVGKTTILKRFNNELRERKDEYQFQVVIMLEVANIRTLNVVGMQRTISKRLGVPWNTDELDVDRADFLIRALTKKKFVVLLDDVWNEFKLERIGIPTLLPEDYGSKLIVVSRWDSVCVNMGAKRPIQMHCLQKDEPQKLLLSKLTENVRAKVLTHNEMNICASEILKSCGGLPLAINVIGSALATSDISETWYHAAAAIKQNPSIIKGVDWMLTVLKYSYDMLEDTAKKCFLYCTIFPDYGSISHEQLVDYWVAEGFISPEPYEGYPIINKLLSAGLLQRSDTDPASEVKMHQMIRIMGRQQAFSENKLLIKAGQALQQAPDAEEWEEATRISLMSNDITELSISPNCRKLLTLLLQNNPNLHQLGPKFFRFMPTLKVLDLSHTAISMLPDCSRLVQLIYLNLSHTPIREVPKQLYNALLELQYLNMSRTLITTLPQQLAKLQKLTHLNLGETSALVVIPHSTISRLLKLKVLNIYKSNYGVKQLHDLNLEGLGQLTYLGITIYSQQVFCKLTKSNLLARCTRLLSLSRCPGMKSIQFSEFKMMSHLMELNIESCDDLEELIVNCNNWNYGAKRVKVLTLINLPNLVNVFIEYAMHQFEDLRDLTIHKCPKLKDASWALQIESLERLVITECYGLQRLVPEVFFDEVLTKDEVFFEGVFLEDDMEDDFYEVNELEVAELAGNIDEAPLDAFTNVGLSKIGIQEERIGCDGRVAFHPGGEAKPSGYVYNVALDSSNEVEPIRNIDEAASDHITEVEHTRYFDESSHMTMSPKQPIQAGTRLGKGKTRMFPYLASITVDRCPNLIQLPDSQMYPSLKQICGEGSWWETIEPKVKANFGDLFVPI